MPLSLISLKVIPKSAGVSKRFERKRKTDSIVKFWIDPKSYPASLPLACLRQSRCTPLWGGSEQIRLPPFRR